MNFAAMHELIRNWFILGFELDVLEKEYAGFNRTRFNVFHFYASKTLFKSGWDLPFYRLFGKKVVMEYLGIDVQKYRHSVESFQYTNIIHIVNEEDAEEHDRTIVERLKLHDKYVDLQLVCAPCYSPFVEESKVLPLSLEWKNTS